MASPKKRQEAAVAVAETPTPSDVLIDELPPMDPAESGIQEVDDDDDIDVGAPDEVTSLDDDDDYEFDTPEAMTTTANFMGRAAAPEIVDQIVEVAPAVTDNRGKRTVRPTEDIGPVFYGEQLIEMKAGHRYSVPHHIHHYLVSRGLLLGGR